MNIILLLRSNVSKMGNLDLRNYFWRVEKYIRQLLGDIARASENVVWPFPTHSLDLRDWLSPEEEEETAPRQQLEDWTGISKEQLPPSRMLNEDQVNRLLGALKTMLNNYNWSFVLQTEVPQHIQYDAIRENFDQEAILKQWHMGFFELCRPDTPHKTCSLGEYCQCAFFAELRAGFVNEELGPEEERVRELEIEVNHLKKKHGSSWMKYYPYHLDPEYDDENGNPHDYGMGDGSDEDNDQWWRK